MVLLFGYLILFDHIFILGLPHKREIEIDSGIWIELFFEHLNWLSNAVVICLRVAELGEATMCEANLNYDSLPEDVQNIHFHQTTTNVLRQVVQVGFQVNKFLLTSRQSGMLP